MFFLTTKASLKQIRWLPVMFFCAVMMLGLRLHEKHQTFFQGREENFFSPFSFFSGTPLKAASAPKETSKAVAEAKPQSAQTSIPLSTVAAGGSPAESPKKPAALDVLNLTTEEVKILQSLAARRGEIERREKALNEKEKIVSLIEKRIQEKVAELEGIQESLKALVAVREKQENEELKGLVKLYELMKPEKAAEILMGLGADILVDLLNGMKDNKLAPILAHMDPVIAQQITVALADRRRLTQEMQQVAQKKPVP